MTSHLALLTIIDGLVQRIDRVNVCHNHWRLVATSLALLQHELLEKEAVDDPKQLFEDIEETLIAINEVLASCTEREIGLNGVTYRDLKSLLLRIHLRLAQHEADLTNNYQTKIKILSDAYHDQQILAQKLFDDTIKKRLETIEQDTKQNTIAQLCSLREKHFDTITAYLCGCTELHKSVPLTGLTGDIVTKVAHTFYNISSDDQIQLEHSWQGCELPLTRTFIQFKPDKSTSFERNESRRLLIGAEGNLLPGPHNNNEVYRGIWDRLVSAPYMMSIVERDRYAEEEGDTTEEHIIRTKRWIVILPKNFRAPHHSVWSAHPSQK